MSLDHSIDPIIPPARTAAARIACLVLVCFMEDSIGAQPCASCLWAVDLNQQPAWLVWKRDRALIFMAATLSFGSGRTSGINHTRPKKRAFNFQGISNRRFNDCLITPTLMLLETTCQLRHFRVSVRRWRVCSTDRNTFCLMWFRRSLVRPRLANPPIAAEGGRLRYKTVVHPSSAPSELRATTRVWPRKFCIYSSWTSSSLASARSRTSRPSVNQP